jgi:hypothetical protein
MVKLEGGNVHAHVPIWSAGRVLQTTPLPPSKGTVAQDYQILIFFTNGLPMDPEDKPHIFLIIFQIHEDIEKEHKELVSKTPSIRHQLCRRQFQSSQRHHSIKSVSDSADTNKTTLTETMN